MKKTGEKHFLKKEYGGTITVFLTLSLTIVISLISAVIASARDRSMRMRCENAMDLGLLSVFGEYSRPLLEEFDLYFIDCSYGAPSGSAYNTGERLKDYIGYNLNPAKGEYLTFSRDLNALSASEVNVSMESLATDSGARVYKRQATQYIKDKYGLSALEKLDKFEKEYKQYKIDEYDPEEGRKKVQKQLDEIKGVEDDEGNEVELENPVENVESESSAVMDLFFGETEISGKSMDTGNLYSNRETAAGCGIVANTEDLDSIKNGLLFDLYMVDKFPNYTAPGEKADLAYELEYIICGKDNDKDNIQSVAAQLFAVRYAANAMLILTDETLIAQAEAAAVAVALVTLCPEVKEPLTQAILYAWAFAESCVDIRTLLDGGKVPLIKSAESLVIDSVPKVLGYKLYLDEGKSVETGFSYMNYLQLLMLPVSGEKKLTRSIDLIENRLRNMQGYENFKMDNCIEYLEAEVKIKSGFGREYQVKRSFGYMGMPKVSY